MKAIPMVLIDWQIEDHSGGCVRKTLYNVKMKEMTPFL